MARIPLATRDRVADKEKPAYDAFMASRQNRPNIGPYSLLVHMPEMAQRLEALRTYLRDEASLSQKLQELVMISVASEMGCAFIWYAHAAAADRPESAATSSTSSARSARPPTSSRRSRRSWTSPASSSAPQGQPRDVRGRRRPVRSAGDDDADEPDRLLRGAGVQHEHLRAGSPGSPDGESPARELIRERRSAPADGVAVEVFVGVVDVGQRVSPGDEAVDVEAAARTQSAMRGMSWRGWLEP